MIITYIIVNNICLLGIHNISVQIVYAHINNIGIPTWCSGKEFAAMARDTRDVGSIRVGKSPGIGNGNPLQYYCLENSMDRRTWQTTSPWGLKESEMAE